ncbi:MBL fold metallo-hydrolase [Ferrovibrio sp.]|uniref:MBL fold metallo-hydrolase n=1 Tax=Ferrovibrio sp. TaxID=1917215 RepID=UPI0025BEBCEA|nr:MBL fold metallo-hydrolase [Ferrovibrio sp.]MBX3453969.1 MBL fold metallo-hydrolase [Ferrovibrio sp.]
MKITLLGTGCPQVSSARRGPANLLDWQGKQYLIDCGSGVTQRLVEAGTAGRAIEALLLTHLHSDHLVDLYQLIVSSWHQGRDRPQRIYGPVGTKRFADGLMALWKPELDARIAHEKRPSTKALELDVTELQPGDVLREGDLTITAVGVRHQPVTNAFGFIFQDAHHRVGFSGDTAYCPELIEASRGADALVHECFIHREIMIRPGIRSEEGTRNVASYHTLSSEVGKVAREAQVKCLILNHFVPVEFDRAALLAEVRADFAGSLVVGEDLMRFDCAARSLTHNGAVIGF